MSWTIKERETFIEFYERKYGVLLKENDEILSVLHFIFDKTNLTESQVIRTHELINLLEVKVKDIKGHLQPKQFQLDGDAAWKWQMGSIRKIFAIAAIAISAIILLFHLGVGFGKVQKANNLINSQPFQKYLFNTIKTDNLGFYYIDISKSKNDSTNVWTDYLPINDSTARVYVGLKK